jgi:hypothetical protein
LSRQLCGPIDCVKSSDLRTKDFSKPLETGFRWRIWRYCRCERCIQQRRTLHARHRKLLNAPAKET